MKHFASLLGAILVLFSSPAISGPIDLIHATYDQLGYFAKMERDARIIEQIIAAKRLLPGIQSTKAELLTVPLEPSGFSAAYEDASSNDESNVPDMKAHSVQEAIIRMFENGDL